MPAIAVADAPINALVPASPRRRAVATAPMRVSFAGGGSDLAPFLPGIGGRVVGTAIDLRVRAEVDPFDRGWVRLELSTVDRVLTRRRGDPPGSDIAFRLLEAALADLGIEDGVRLRIETSVIPGAGLGGSGAAAVAAIAALWASIREAPAEAEPRRNAAPAEAEPRRNAAPRAAVLSPDELAREALLVERERLRLACGPQDPIFAACGGMLDLRFDDRGAMTRADLTVAPDLFAAFAAGLLLIDTGRRRVSGEVLDRQHTRPEISAELVAAAGDVVDGFTAGSLDRVLAGMRRSAAAKVRRDPSGNSVDEAMARQLEQNGAEVARMCGAGEGGHVLVWAPPDRHASIGAAVGCTVRKPALAAPGVRMETE